MGNLDLFDPYSVDENKLLLAKHLPIGKAWERGFSPDSNLGKYLLGLAMEFYRFEVLTSLTSDEIDINQTDQLIVEWEKSVGLPDSCFLYNINDTLTQRRAKVLAKFSKYGGVQTAEDFVRVAALFGLTIYVNPGMGAGSFPLTFPIIFYDDYKIATHTITIGITGVTGESDIFPLPFPLPFGLGPVAFLTCIFSKLAPANVAVNVIHEGEL